MISAGNRCRRYKVLIVMRAGAYGPAAQAATVASST